MAILAPSHREMALDATATTRREISRAVAPAWRRLAAQVIMLWALRGTATGLLIAAGVEGIAHLTPWIGANTVAIAAIVVAAIGGVAIGVARHPSTEATVALVDRRLGLHDRLTTGWDYAGLSAPLLTMQRADTATSLQGLDVRRATPWSVPRREVITLLVALLLVGGVLRIPNPMEATLRQQAAQQARLRAAAAAIQHVAPPTIHQQVTPRQNPLSAAEVRRRAEIARQLAALQEQLRKAPNTATALKDVSTTQQHLATLAPPQSAATAAMLRALSSMLGSASQQLPSSISKAVQQSATNPATLSNALQQLAKNLGKLNSAQQAALAKSLASAANSASASPNLASSLQQAAAALGRADTAGGTSALQSAAQAAAKAAADAQAAADVSATNKALDSLKNQIAGLPDTTGNAGGTSGTSSSSAGGQSGQGNASTAQGQTAGQGSAQGSDQGQGANQGQGAGQSQNGDQGQGAGQDAGQGQGNTPGQNSGQGQGQGNTPGSGQGQQGSAAGSGQGQGATQGSGQGTGQGQSSGQGQGQGGTGHGGSGGGTAAGNRTGATGEHIYVPGHSGSGPQTTTTGPNAQSTNGQSVPYQDALAQYNQSARASLERQALPPALQSAVGQYFSALNR